MKRLDKNMVLPRTLLMLSLALFFCAHARADDSSISLVGLDSEDNPVEIFIEKKEYSARVSAVTTSVSDSLMRAFGRKRESRPTAEPWALRTVVVGVGVGIEAGLGPIISVKAVPRFKLVYSNSADPVLP